MVSERTSYEKTAIENLTDLLNQGEFTYIEQMVLDDIVFWKQTQNLDHLKWAIENLELIYKAKCWEKLTKEKAE